MARRAFEGTRNVVEWLGRLPEVEMGEMKIRLRENAAMDRTWEEWGAKVEHLMRHEEPRLLLLLDEFPILVQHLLAQEHGETGKFLRWLRRLRQDRATHGRFVFCGSINLPTTLSARHG